MKMIQKITLALLFYILIVYASKDLNQRLLNDTESPKLQLELVTTTQESNDDVNLNMNEMELVTKTQKSNDVNVNMNEMELITPTQESNDLNLNVAKIRLITYTPDELIDYVFCQKPSYSIFKYLDLKDLNKLGNVSAKICRNMLPIFNELAKSQLQTIQKYFSLETNLVLKPEENIIETWYVIKDFPVKITNKKFTCDSPTEGFRWQIIQFNKNGLYFPFTIKSFERGDHHTLIYLPSLNISSLNSSYYYHPNDKNPKLECSFDERHELPYQGNQNLTIEMHMEDTEEEILRKKKVEIRKRECRAYCIDIIVTFCAFLVVACAISLIGYAIAYPCHGGPPCHGGHGHY